MAKVPRKLQKIFSSASSANGQFGSFQAGTKILSNDTDVLQALSAWLTGWFTATAGSQNVPTAEELNGVMFTVTQQLAYLLQEGISEYDATTTYFQKSIVKKVGTYQLYGSVTDNNTGNALTDPTNWVSLGDLSSVGNVVGQASSVDSEVSLFSGTTGKVIKRATGTGFMKMIAGVLQSAATTIGTSEMANNSVTNAIAAQMPANSVKVNNTTSTANATEIMLAVTELVGRASAGNVQNIALGTNLSMSGNVLNAASYTPNIFNSTAQTLTTSSTLTIAHGLGAEPTIIQLILQNVTTNLGWSPGDRVFYPALADDSGATNGFNISADATNIYILQAAGSPLLLTKGSPGSASPLTPANWSLFVRGIKL